MIIYVEVKGQHQELKVPQNSTSITLKESPNSVWESVLCSCFRLGYKCFGDLK